MEKKAKYRKPLYTQLLSKEERADCLLTGMMLKGASVGASFDQVKQAGLGSAIAGTADFGTKAVIATSLLTGIPAGIVAHLLHKRIKKQDIKEQELLNKDEYYRDAADLIEDELAKNQVTY